MKNMIEITGVDLKEFTKKVYELSFPQGLGFMHFTPEPLSDAEAERIVKFGTDPIFDRPNDRIALSMDYVKGRACKMTVFREDKKLFISCSWYDHSDRQLKELLTHFNITLSETKEHSYSCNCVECIQKTRP